jgi:transposase
MNDLHWLLDNDPESGYRARIILLRDEGYTVPEIRRITNHHNNNIRKWIHRFNEKDVDGIISRKHIRNANKITDDIERKIVEITSNDPKKLQIEILYMVITRTCRIHNGRNEVGR